MVDFSTTQEENFISTYNDIKSVNKDNKLDFNKISAFSADNGEFILVVKMEFIKK